MDGCLSIIANSFGCLNDMQPDILRKLSGSSCIITLANANFITEYYFHPIVHTFIFYCLQVCIGFTLTYLFINPIFFNEFLTVLSQKFTPFLIHLFFINFLEQFLFSRHFALSFLS